MPGRFFPTSMTMQSAGNSKARAVSINIICHATREFPKNLLDGGTVLGHLHFYKSCQPGSGVQTALRAS